MCSVHSLIITFLFQGCFLGAAPGSEEGKLNTHSKNRGGVGEPPVAWFQCVHQLAFTFWLTPPVISRLTLFYTLSFWLFFIFFSPRLILELSFQIVPLYFTWIFSFAGQNGISQNSNFHPTFFQRTDLFPMLSILSRSHSLVSYNLIMCLFEAVTIHPCTNIEK